MCMFLCKGKTLFFHSLINQRLFGCFTIRKIQIFLKVMLDCSDFYLLQQLWMEILQLQGCQTRVLLEFFFQDGVIQLRCLLLPPNLCLGTVLFGSSLAAAKSLMVVAFSLPLCSYMTFIRIFSCLHARIQAFSLSLVYFPGTLSKLQIFKTPLHKLHF